MKSAEGRLKRPIEFQIVNEYRGAISALNTGDPFMASKADSVLGRSVLEFRAGRGPVGPAEVPQLAPSRGGRLSLDPDKRAVSRAAYRAVRAWSTLSPHAPRSPAASWGRGGCRARAAGFTIVGLPDAALSEARERVRGALRNAGFHHPPRRITVNLAPAELRKAGASLDLAHRARDPPWVGAAARRAGPRGADR